MTCAYCQHRNNEEDHRCRKCQRRLKGTAAPAPAFLAEQHVRIAVRALGANALSGAAVVERAVAVEHAPQAATASAARIRNEISIDSAPTLDALPARGAPGEQSNLFGAELKPKIIPFAPAKPASPVRTLEPLPQRVEPAPQPLPPAAKVKPQARAAVAPRTRRTALEESQGTLDFLPPAKSAPRTLKTNAEAVIFCDAVVASPMHRSTAAALDLCMIVIAFGAVLATFETWAHPTLDRTALVVLSGLLGLTALFYGLLFAVAGGATPGMQWTHLRLINFDGFPPDGRSRFVRFAGCWVSVLSGGLGLVWSLLDEENLTWHDHISKTFPTLRESESIVVRRAKR